MHGQIKKCVFYELGFFHIRSFLNKVIFHRGVINIHLFDIVIYFKTNIKCNFPILKDEGWLLSVFEGLLVNILQTFLATNIGIPRRRHQSNRISISQSIFHRKGVIKKIIFADMSVNWWGGGGLTPVRNFFFLSFF